ncbi:MAG: recombinase RecT [Clostridia bacterium]|nr:recombinase RecT [Clostridia bacterium]MBQ8836476.1 recombinase RecT [Clostridia bacterium]
MANTIQNKVSAVNQNGEKKTMQMYIKAMEGEIKKALPSVITPERFTRMVLSAISTNPKLASCTPASFLGAMMSAAQLGLEPNTPLGQAYLIPYKNKGRDEVQFQLGYKGLIDLAYRSGEVELVQAHIVYENDTFECEYGLEPRLVHKPADSDRGEPMRVYAMFKTKSGGYGFEVMSMDDVRRHAEKYSQAYKSGFSPWKTNFEEMAKKTVLKRVLKYAPLKSDFVRAVVQDESIKNEISDDMYEVQSETVFEAEYTEADEETGEVIE